MVLLGYGKLQAQPNTAFPLLEFFLYNPQLEQKVDAQFAALTDTQRVAQMIVTSGGKVGKNDNTVLQLVHEGKVGGVILLGGEKENLTSFIQQINDTCLAGGHPLPMISMDAEPTLMPSRLKGSPELKKTSELSTAEEVRSTATLISNTLKEMGVHQNFAPVVDVSKESKFISSRSFGASIDTVSLLGQDFIEATQLQGVVATAKHFPGHGFVTGDTHKESVYIDGALEEMAVYKPLIDVGVLSIMVGHINVKNNEKWGTDGLPATLSRKIVTELLRDSLDFRGLIITDAINMAAARSVDNPPLMASKAGCDMLLMPKDEGEVIDSILEEMKLDEAYTQQVYASVKKILRLKICLGLVK